MGCCLCLTLAGSSGFTGKVRWQQVLSYRPMNFSLREEKEIVRQPLSTRRILFLQNPEELICLAHELFSTKGDDGFIPSIQYVADLLADEAGRYFHYHLPSNVLENRDVWLTTILVSRDHLPDNTLKPEIVYPMLILPDDGPDAMILPYWYWQK